MERWERPPPRRGRNNPSFSSSLLDAIYRSIDESDGGGGGPPRDHRKGGPDPCFSSSSAAAAARKKKSADELKWTTAAVIRRGSWDYSRGLVTPTSSSSESSSYGGFSSSSDAESAASYYSAGVNPARSNRILADPEVPPEKKKNGSFRSRLRDLRKCRAPTSPGARLASFLNTLFVAAENPKKSKISTLPLPKSACTSASSYSRSCLSKMPVTPSVAMEGARGERRENRGFLFDYTGPNKGFLFAYTGQESSVRLDMFGPVRPNRMLSVKAKGMKGGGVRGRKSTHRFWKGHCSRAGKVPMPIAEEVLRRYRACAKEGEGEGEGKREGDGFEWVG